ncbi:hypothetical protein MTR_7g066320 [Medicago truncatula]|uniref:Uncharacterized protein n=1 Tax=Medicago truncatula TaxID=3880 RepID=A0A072UB68_MEDTR|nr:hypothetical protein MTR_7g066320 [Medicago truncatula]
MLRVGFEPTPYRTRTLIWRLRPTRPSQLDKAMKKNQNSNLISSDDVAINCLARVPRSHHTTLTLVSKPIHSLLSSSPLA